MATVLEAPSQRAVLRHYRMSAFKARPVLDLIRGLEVDRAAEVLRLCPRGAARVIGKLLASAVANAENNAQLSADELYVSACYADEAKTLKRWRPRARGRATRIRKRTCHITIVVSRLPEERLRRRRERAELEAAARRSRRVAGTRSRERRQAAARAPAPTPEVAEPVAGEPGAAEAEATGPEADTEAAPGAGAAEVEATEAEPAEAVPAEAEATGPEADTEAAPGAGAAEVEATEAEADEPGGESRSARDEDGE
jgi:large subunit ribosomal protein L22